MLTENSSHGEIRQTRSTAYYVSTKSNKVKSCNIVNLVSLVNGSFHGRLRISLEQTHLPSPAESKHSELKIHKWAEKFTCKHLAYCSGWNVCLCIKWCKVFHTVLNIFHNLLHIMYNVNFMNGHIGEVIIYPPALVQEYAWFKFNPNFQELDN